ncbi:MAG: polyprenyl synthetase family protein [Myxococcota bacterium]
MSELSIPRRDPQSFESFLEATLSRAAAHPCPPGLARALHYAVFPGGQRLRPRLLEAVAEASGGAHPGLILRASAAIELLHCASLVHDDLPCFDDADARRGRPSVHRAFSEATAVLVGDALIALAFEQLAAAQPAGAMAEVLACLARGVTPPFGIIAGQAWESEERVDRATYHRLKTGALFVAATRAGALAGGGDPAQWALLGERIGEAYQVADDLKDALSSEEELGKPIKRDQILGRPSAVRDLGVKGALSLLERLLEQAEDAVPAGPNKAAVIGTFLSPMVELRRKIHRPALRSVV